MDQPALLSENARLRALIREQTRTIADRDAALAVCRRSGIVRPRSWAPKTEGGGGAPAADIMSEVWPRVLTFFNTRELLLRMAVLSRSFNRAAPLRVRKIWVRHRPVASLDDTLRRRSERFGNVSEVSVRGCKVLSDGAIVALGARCGARLIALDVSECFNLSDAAVISIAQNCRMLTALSAKCCRKLTDASITALAACCGGALQRLDVAGCNRIEGESLIALGASCPRLRHLRIAHLDRVVDAQFIALAKGCPALESIDVHGCSRLSDAALFALATHCGKTLLSLTVKGVWNLTDAAIERVATEAKNLQHLDISACWNISDALVGRVKALCPALAHLFQLSPAGLIMDHGNAR